MTDKRFYVAMSHAYGLCVYDREMGNIPATSAICDLLPAKTTADGFCVPLPSATFIDNEVRATMLCHRLNVADKRRKALENYRIEQSPYGLWYINYYIGNELQFDVYGGYKSRSVAKGIATRKGITIKEVAQ